MCSKKGGCRIPFHLRTVSLASTVAIADAATSAMAATVGTMSNAQPEASAIGACMLCNIGCFATKARACGKERAMGRVLQMAWFVYRSSYRSS